MSSTGQVVGGIVGAVIGFYTVGPVYGAQIGMMVGGLMDPPKVLGPRLDDLSTQTSTYGAFIPRIYGTAPVTGNIFWIQGNQLIEKTVESSGKGGQQVTNFEYFATFAVGLCEGPIDGVRRIWIGGQLWYDAGTSDLASIISSNENAGTFTLYTGSETQLADPMIQADHGVANVPAYRGLAYIVFNELPIKDYGNSLAGAQVKVEIVRNGTYQNSLIENEVFPDETGWVGRGASSNQFDIYGMKNFVIQKSNYPVWFKSIYGNTSTSTISDSAFPLLAGGTTLFPDVSAVSGGVSSSLDTMQFVFMSRSQYLVWGRAGVLHAYDTGSTLARAYAFSESAGIIYSVIVDGSDKYICLLGENSPIGNLTTFTSRALISSTSKPVIGVWGEKCVSAFREFDYSNLDVNVYGDSYGSLVLLDSYSLALPALEAHESYVIDYEDSAAQVQADKLYIIRATTVLAPYIKTSRLIVVDLLTRTLDAVYSLPESFVNLTSPRQANIKVINDIVYYGQTCNSLPTEQFISAAWVINRITGTATQLSTIVQAECLNSELLASTDIDVTELTDTVRGYRISSLAPLRGGIDPLRKAWPFDAVQHGYKIKFKRRGGTSVATITAGELDARAAGSDHGVQITNVREMDLVLPNQLTAKYLDATREYDVNVAEDSRQ